MLVNWQDIMAGHVHLSEITIFSRTENNCNFFVSCDRKHG